MNNKKALLISSLLILLPIPVGLLLWNRFPEEMIVHWGFTGDPNGWATIPFTVFFPPLALLLGQWVCIYFTRQDPGNQGRNHKPLSLVLWIMPVLSNLTSGMMFALALGADFSPVSWMMAAMGLMFAAIGNYLPKCKMNATMGIKVPWAYTSEENWNATHRFGGRVWVIGGLALIFTGFLPETTAFFCMFFAILVLALVPMVYSYLYYRKQKARGDALKPLPKGAGLTKGSAIFLACLLVFVAIILFSGDLEYRFEEEYLTIDASFYQDLMIDYGSIEALELREETVPGFRVGGFSSFRLLMGFFQNEEFGIHTRYTYYDPECCIVALWRGKPVVLSGEDAAQTRDLYRKLLEKVSQ